MPTAYAWYMYSDAVNVSKDDVARFQAASLWRARWQLTNSFIPYVLLWVAMVYALAVSYWLMLPLALLAAGFLARIFIIFHDCGHGSFFKSRRANDAVGFIRHQLADALSLRLAPDLHFVLDNSGKYGARIDELLHRIDKRGKKKTP